MSTRTTEELKKSSALKGQRVINDVTDKKIGTVHHVLFHPKTNKVLGLAVKRPDIALMFHRSDCYITLRQLSFADTYIRARLDNSQSTPLSETSIQWDHTVIWDGLPVLTQDQEALGHVKSVIFEAKTGMLEGLVLTSGLTADALLGEIMLPSDVICGFQSGIGDALMAHTSFASASRAVDIKGALVVTNAAKDIVSSGGLAEIAGKSSAVVVGKVKKVGAQAAPHVEKLKKSSSEALDKGSYKFGHQIGQTKGMFASFKEEFDKAKK